MAFSVTGKETFKIDTFFSNYRDRYHMVCGSWLISGRADAVTVHLFFSALRTPWLGTVVGRRVLDPLIGTETSSEGLWWCGAEGQETGTDTGRLPRVCVHTYLCLPAFVWNSNRMKQIGSEQSATSDVQMYPNQASSGLDSSIISWNW